MTKITQKIWRTLLSTVCYVGNDFYRIDLINDKLEVVASPFGKVLIASPVSFSV